MHGSRVRLVSKATSRAELPADFLIRCPQGGEHLLMHPSDVYAVSDSTAQAGLSALGAAIGLLGGGAGIVVGGLIGALLGTPRAREDQEMARRFDESHE